MFIVIYVYYKVIGDNFFDKDVDCVVVLFVEKYCFVMLMLKGNVNIIISYEIM